MQANFRQLQYRGLVETLDRICGAAVLPLVVGITTGVLSTCWFGLWTVWSFGWPEHYLAVSEEVFRLLECPRDPYAACVPDGGLFQLTASELGRATAQLSFCTALLVALAFVCDRALGFAWRERAKRGSNNRT